MDPSLQHLLRRLEQLSEEFRELRDGVEKAVRMADLDPEMALTRARKVLEYIVRDVFERHIQQPPGTRPLENLLQQLAKDGHLPARVEAYANAIRLLGNASTHRFGEKFTAADVNLCLTQLMPILEWYFEVERPDAAASQPAPRLPAKPVGRPTGSSAGEAAPAASRAEPAHSRPGTAGATPAPPVSAAPARAETARKFKCPACGKSLKIAPSGEGKCLRCPSCGQEFQVAGDVLVHPVRRAAGNALPGHDEAAATGRDKRSGVAPPRAPKRMGLIAVCVAAGVVLLGFVALWASSVFTVKSKDDNEVQAPRVGGSAGSDNPKRNGDLGARLVKAANPVVIMDTSMGTIRIELFEDKAPITVKNFLGYVDKGFYDGTIFHRVMGKENFECDFMIQGGGFTKDRREKETGAPIKNEAGNGVQNKRGTLAMARTNDPDSATAQFFINVTDNADLNKAQARGGVGYAVFGEVIEGMDVVDKIKAVKTGYMPFTDRDGHNLNFTNVPEEVVLIRSLRREVSAAPKAQ
jgi:cyclophilin family peptidyl-prolyl cis-trans isomerase